MGTNCTPRVADLFLFSHERDFMRSLTRDDQADIIGTFNSTSRHPDDFINIDRMLVQWKKYLTGGVWFLVGLYRACRAVFQSGTLCSSHIDLQQIQPIKQSKHRN